MSIFEESKSAEVQGRLPNIIDVIRYAGTSEIQDSEINDEIEIRNNPRRPHPSDFSNPSHVSNYNIDQVPSWLV